MDETADTVSVDKPVSELGVQEGVDIVKEIISTLEDGDVSLNRANELRQTADEIIDHLESELEFGDGEISRAETDA